MLLADEPACAGLGDCRYLVGACHNQLLCLSPLADLQIARKLVHGVPALLRRLRRTGLADDAAHPHFRDDLEVQRLRRFVHPKRHPDRAVVLGAQDVFFPSEIRRMWTLKGQWFDGGENGKICGKGMNAARQNCEQFSSMGSPLKMP